MNRTPRRVVAVLAALFVWCLAGAALADALADAERALAENRLQDAIEAYEAIAADESRPGEVRSAAYRGLAVARDGLQWGAASVVPLSRSLSLDPSHAGSPCVINWIDRSLSNHGVRPDARVEIERAIEAGAGIPHTEYWLHDLVVSLTEMDGDRSGGVELWNRYAFIQDVLVVGPFLNTGGSGLRTPYPPELEIDLDAEYHDRLGRPVVWRPFHTGPRGRIDFDMVFDDEPDAVGYALTHVRLDSTMGGYLHLMGRGACAVWLNGELVFVDDDPKATGAKWYDLPVTFAEGWNRILLKAGAETELLRWYVAIRDGDGLPLDVEAGTDPTVYAGPDAVEDIGDASPTTGMEAFSENHYVRAWYDKAQEMPLPDIVILAGFLERGGHVDALEDLLDVAEERFPDSGSLGLIRARTLDFREQSGEAAALRRRIAQNAPLFVEACASVVQELLNQGDVEGATEAMEALEEQPVRGRYHRLLSAGLELHRSNVAGAMAILESLYEETPGDRAVRGVYLGQLRSAGDKREYAERMREAMAVRPDDMSHMRSCAGLAYGEGEYDEALAILDDMLEFWIRRDDVHMEIATVLEADGREEEALEHYREALACSPVKESAHKSLAHTLLKLDRKDEALEHLEAAAERDPYSLELRDRIREVRGEPPLRDYFTKEDVGELSRADMSWIDGEPEAVSLIDAASVIVYPDGAQYVRQHVATKILTPAGVEQHRKMDAPVFWSDSQGKIEIARTIKADGREIEAERGFGEIVFADVEPGDVIEYRYSMNYSPEVGLKGHFWINHYFQFSIPCLLARLAILHPKDVEYDWVCHNADIEPVLTRHGDWTLATWEDGEVQADAIETSMPPYDERVAWVDVSTIRSWDDIVDWYVVQSRGRIRAGERVRELAAELGEGAPDDSTLIRRVTHHVMNEIRYEGGQFSDSAVVPRSSEEVLRTGFGDCKDQSGLIISLLGELGVDAGFALVNSRAEKSVPYLPSPRFTHVVVRAVADDGSVYWVDPTAVGQRFPNIPVMLENAPALLVDAERPEFVTVPTELATSNGHRSEATGSLSAEGSLTLAGECRYRGEDAAAVRMLLHWMPEYRQQVAEGMLTERFPGARVASAELTGDGDPESDVTFSYDMTYPTAATLTGGLMILEPPWTISTVPYELVSTETREEPLMLNSWRGLYVEKVRIELPEGCEPIEELQSADVSCGLGRFTLARRVDGNTLVLEKSFELRELRLEPEDYPEFREFLEKAWRAEKQPVVLKLAS